MALKISTWNSKTLSIEFTLLIDNFVLLGHGIKGLGLVTLVSVTKSGIGKVL